MCMHKTPATRKTERTGARGFIISTEKIEFFSSQMPVEAYLKVVTAGKKGKIKKFTERGQGIFDLGGRDEHLDKQREDRKEEEEHGHFKRYEKIKK